MVEWKSYRNLTIILLLFCCLHLQSNNIVSGAFRMVGGISGESEATEDVQDIVSRTKAAFEEKAGQSFDEFTAVKFASQTVAGRNYFVKVKVGEDSYVHVRIFVPLPHTGNPIEAAAIKMGMAESDPIEYFSN